jgi:hypothetical protein
MPALHLTAAPGCMGLRSSLFSCFLLVSLCCPHGRGDRGKYYAVPLFELVLLLDDVLFRNNCQNQRIEQLRDPYETVSTQVSQCTDNIPVSSLAETSNSSMPFSRPHSRSSSSSSSYSSAPLPLSCSGVSAHGLPLLGATPVCALRRAAPARPGGVSKLLEWESVGECLAEADMVRGADRIDVKDVKRGRM